MYKYQLLALLLLPVLFWSCSRSNQADNSDNNIYIDKPYWQDYSVKYFFSDSKITPQKAIADRNGSIRVLASDKLFIPGNAKFQYPGTFVPDRSYIPFQNMMIKDIITIGSQFVYLTDKAVVSNAWAGKLLLKHNLPKAKILSGNRSFEFLISDGNNLLFLTSEGEQGSYDISGDEIVSIKTNGVNSFMVLTESALYSFLTLNKQLKKIFDYSGEGTLTAMDVSVDGNLVIGTTNGYLTINSRGKITEELNPKLPCTEITTVKVLNGKLWFGSESGAFMLKNDGKFNYYFGERWLPGEKVIDIASGPDDSVIILTDRGVGQICFKKMTLEEKAMHFEKQVRARHIRYGLNATSAGLINHNLDTYTLRRADSDNLWTSMYLGSQLFRYLVTGSDEAKQNCYEAFEALERMHTITNIKGLYGRTFERSGNQVFHKEYRSYVEKYWYPGYNNTTSWHHANEDWDWRGTASSDQTAGQIFAMTLIAEYIDDPHWKARAVTILDDLMMYIVENDYTLVDVDGKPTLWGRWGPDYVNRFDTVIGDRKLYSSNLIAFLQSAYKHTGKSIYKEKAFDLLHNHHYLENLTRPFSSIGRAPDDADEWSKMLSEEWNHSDDEMYFLSYWSLYPYSLNDTLQQKYEQAIKDHWQCERPEKNPLWNFCYAMTGAEDFDLEESVWTLKEWPLDMIEFEVKNSHRKDIEFIEKNFWGQLSGSVLPPDERAELKHNRNLFKPDVGDRHDELSAGDTFLLPYWMGRFLGVISAPAGNDKIRN